MAKKVEQFETETSSKYGKKSEYDPNFKGPIANRGCTDIICCLLFLVFLAGWGIIATIAIMNGNPDRLIYPTDTQGRICGQDPFTSKPNLIFFDLTVCARLGPALAINGCPTPQVCVTECPSKTLYFPPLIAGGTLDAFSPDLYKDFADFCVDGVTPTDNNHYEALIKEDKCPRWLIESKSYIGRCMPFVFEEIASALQSAGGDASDGNSTVTEVQEGSKFIALWMSAQQIGERLFQDITVSWWMMLIGLVVAMFVALFWIILMRFFAGIMVWLSMLAAVGLLGFGTYFCFNEYFKLKDVAGSDRPIEFTTNLASYLELQDTWLVFGISCAVVLAIVLLILLFLRKRIQIAIALINEASRAVGSMLFSLIFPLFTFFLEVVVFAWFCGVAVMIASSGKPSYVVQGIGNVMSGNVEVPCECTDTRANATMSGPYVFGSDCIPDDIDAMSMQGQMSHEQCCENITCIFKTYGGDPNLFRSQVYNLFGLFWCMMFVVALGQMTLAGGFASYYWAFTKPKDIPAFALTRSFYRAIRYHTGTLAFGSLLIAIVKLIRAFLEYMEHQLKDVQNPVGKFILRCCKCCFWCLEKFLKFLTKNAYIYCAIYGTNFCTSARKAFFLLMRNIIRVFVLDNVTDFLLFIGKLVVVGVTATASYYFFSKEIATYIPELGTSVPELNYYYVPIIIITLGAYFIASGFFSVYGMAVDTLFLCFLEDSERNDGSQEKPYFMSKELKKIVSKENKFKDPKD